MSVSHAGSLAESSLIVLLVYECEVLTRQGTKILRMRRYNDFLALYTSLRKAFPVRAGQVLEFVI